MTKAPGVRRLGVFGGAFDPPHLAHVALMQAAMKQLQLDQLRVLPTGQAWHKTRSLSEPAHRLAMTRLAFEGQSRVVVDDREITRLGPTYTVDTLHELQAEFPQAQLYLLVGNDQRRSLASWYEIEVIGRIAIICAASRDTGVKAWSDSGSTPSQPLSDAIEARIQILNMPLMPHSATDIRVLVATDQAISGLVPTAVERYIHEHHLYRPHR